MDEEDEAHYREHIFSLLSIGSEIVTYYAHQFTVQHNEIQQSNEPYQWVNSGKIILLDSAKNRKGEMSVSGAALILQGTFAVDVIKNQKFSSLRFEPKRISNADGLIFPKISIRNRSIDKYKKIFTTIDNNQLLTETNENIDDITKTDLGDFIAVFNEIKMKYNFPSNVNYLYAKLAYVIVYNNNGNQ